MQAPWATSRPRLASKVTASPHPGHGAYKGTLWDPLAKIAGALVAGNSNLKFGVRPRGAAMVTARKMGGGTTGSRETPITEKLCLEVGLSIFRRSPPIHPNIYQLRLAMQTELGDAHSRNLPQTIRMLSPHNHQTL